jgi:hypothetical protein
MVLRNQGRASGGSRKWLQILVNERPELVDRVLARSLGLAQGECVHWLSPLKDNNYVEYRDQEFMDKLGISLTKVPLESFWPRQGPVWDGLARTDRGDLILVEAKAHISELVSDPTKASGRSLSKIRESLDTVKRFYGSGSDADWATCFYQYTNRLAHLYLLRECNSLPAYLLCLYFINDEDVDGPSTRSAWEGAIELLESFLVIRREKLCGVLKVFIDVKELEPALPSL